MLSQFIQWLKETSNIPLERSYLFMRKCVGVIGVALPPVLIIGLMILERQSKILDSISAYYYSDYISDYSVIGNTFVGSMCATGIFLIGYRYQHLDDFVSTVAGACAIGVALFPTTPPDRPATEVQMIIGILHASFATGFFVTLAIFALWIFRKSDQKNPTDRTPEKRQRDKVYLFCGITILVCLVLSGLVILLSKLSGKPWQQPLHPMIWLECLAVEAFGIAWFVKGGTLGILKDKKRGVLRSGTWVP
jgi:hypothetical protein